MSAEPAEHASPRSGVPPPLETRWTPGVSGNPTGRPAGYVDFATAARVVSVLTLEQAQDLANGKFPSDWDKLYSVQYVHAARALLAGVPKPETVLDRMDGAVTQKAEHSGPDGAPFTITVRRVE